ncbi:winged helix-turn-helix domain-containing protein [Candidatus Woesearchaeota archaeon]|nr:winged helix-turn-helix domain-containing protein [Candidatus Woesearchaeota archaeon]
MVYVKKEGILLESTKKEFESHAVLNPSIIQQGNTLHMFYRAVAPGNRSSVGYCKLDGPMKITERSDAPILWPEHDYEKQGIEDPRVVHMNGTYYMFYAAYDGKSARGAMATSKDLKKWNKQGIITPNISYDLAEDLFRQSRSKLKEKYFFFESYYKDIVGKDVMLWEKDIFMLPKKIKDKYALIHRVLPDIQVAYFRSFKDLDDKFWEEYLKNLSKYVVLESKYWFESRNIGGGCPMIETKEGWLMIYHAVQDTNHGKIYRAGAALLDKKDPTKVIGHLADPLFSPEEEWEIKGDVDNVVFPTGTAIFDDTLYIYYGAADKRIAVASLHIHELMDELLNRDRYTDIKTEIGFLAGKIFHDCRESPKTVEELSKNLKKPEEQIIMAVGWLLKEGKIGYFNSEHGIRLRTEE